MISPRPPRIHAVLSFGCFLALIFLACCGKPSGQPDTDQEAILQPQRQVLPDENTEEDRIRSVEVYYRHPFIEGIVPVKKEIFKTSNKADLIKQVIDHLTIPPDPEEGFTLWPENTHVREVYTLPDGTVVVDFDGRFIESIRVSVWDEDFMITSLVNSIVENFPEYDKVRILVHGSVQETLLGHIDIEFPLVHRNSIYTIVPTPEVADEVIIEDLLNDANLQKNL